MRLPTYASVTVQSCPNLTVRSESLQLPFENRLRPGPASSKASAPTAAPFWEPPLAQFFSGRAPAPLGAAAHAGTGGTLQRQHFLASLLPAGADGQRGRPSRATVEWYCLLLRGEGGCATMRRVTSPPPSSLPEPFWAATATGQPAISAVLGSVAVAAPNGPDGSEYPEWGTPSRRRGIRAPNGHLGGANFIAHCGPCNICSSAFPVTTPLLLGRVSTCDCYGLQLMDGWMD